MPSLKVYMYLLKNRKPDYLKLRFILFPENLIAKIALYLRQLPVKRQSLTLFTGTTIFLLQGLCTVIPKHFLKRNYLHLTDPLYHSILLSLRIKNLYVKSLLIDIKN